MKRHLILLFVGVSLPFLLAASRKIPSALPKGYYVFRRLRWWANDL